ncbi:D-isomer specific 2-hydroxyacid dehydrogenase [Hyaloraphidium curvatum]|nr:D-isomer specific 2-hydroxyacid dehydrogenase [Hyaloraphidium curvatum]
MPPTALLNAPVPPALADALRAKGMAVFGPFPDPLAAIRDDARVAGSEVLVTFGTIPTDAALLEALPNLRLVAHYGSGYEGADISACLSRGIMVTHSPGANASCVADVAFALVLDVVRRATSGDRFVRTGRWEEDKYGPFRARGPPPGLGELRMGVLGMGAIGEKVAVRASAFEMEVGYCGRTRKEGIDPDYKYFSTPVALAEWCDVLCVCLRADASTKHIVNSEVLDALGPDGFVVNISRGVAIDEVALIRYLKEGKIAGAGLDVFEHEPHIPAELLELGGDDRGGGPSVVLTPHIGGWSRLAARNMTEAVLANVGAWLEGRKPPNPVPEMAEVAKTGSGKV